ncbi:hypothetical protein SS50377_27418 [Spironucleus salmonicida]|uniref:Uncharacterized protein n=1 Tax=Spironucleus salmonicida TaxID=348837 RepID=V6LHW3_9EUKA|nr:hypothetical protein SS50377_27418 [Spironucleus salmonicida]|eukprot:EST43291.1 Hypothetical protein SS50377_16957 [Spironucleus salmonicida]
MKEDTYVRMLDTFTWTVVCLLSLYIILWLIENYNVQSIVIQGVEEFQKQTVVSTQLNPQKPKSKKSKK